MMRRDYTVEQYYELVRRLRDRVKGLALSTDIIVGFPGETEVQFENTMKLLKTLRFDMVHVAAYSPRAGTASARELDDDVPAEEKKRRLDDVEALQARIKTELNSSLLGQEIEILVEEKKDDKWKGRTRTDKLVFLNAEDDLMGQLVNVTIEKTGPWSLQGKMNKKGSVNG
jgi:tRNA-2-methylthio-N6-dimethylallyladenosine synthase